MHVNSPFLSQMETFQSDACFIQPWPFQSPTRPNGGNKDSSPIFLTLCSPKIFSHFQKCLLVSLCLIWYLGGHCFPNTLLLGKAGSPIKPPSMGPFLPFSCMPNLISVRTLTDSSLAERAILVLPTRWLSSGRHRDFHFQGAQEIAGQNF